MVVIGGRAARGQADESLKAAHSRYVALWMSGDVAAIEHSIHQRAVGFWADTAAPTDFQGLSNARRQQALKTLFASSRDLKITVLNIRHRTFENTGVVWGFYKVEFRDKNGSPRTENWRTTEVFVKDAGQWLLASWHLSDIPD